MSLPLTIIDCPPKVLSLTTIKAYTCVCDVNANNGWLANAQQYYTNHIRIHPMSMPKNGDVGGTLQYLYHQ